KVVQAYVSEGNACFVYPSAGTGRKPLYRSYSGATGDHFYTTSLPEHQNAVAHLGYTDEGIACWVPAAAGPVTVPLYRSYHPGASDHFYTTSLPEHQNAVAHLGYTDEGIACPTYATSQPGTSPLFRMFDADTVDHFYTTSAIERNSAEQNVGPNVSLSTTATAMQNAYNQASIQVSVVTTQFISVPPAVDVDVGSCSGSTTSEQNHLFGNRDDVQANDITVYFVRTTVPAFNGCATHPSGQPGAVVAQGATQWTMAHEVGHVLGLSHVNDNTRLMTGNGTANITTNPPVLIASEIATMDGSPYTTDI
ncbi:MAG: hypothetical protein E6J90_25895, partial [Deltaproteobacteria bacterium]